MSLTGLGHDINIGILIYIEFSYFFLGENESGNASLLSENE